MPRNRQSQFALGYRKPGIIPFLLVFLFPVLLDGCARKAQESPADEAAVRLAENFQRQMGGPRAFERLRYLHFDFTVREGAQRVTRRTHLWDRETGDYRLETQEDGQPIIVLFNTRTREGKAFRGYRNQPVSDPAPLIAKALAWHINDTWWLTSPMHLLAPGTRLESGGDMLVAGRLYPSIRFWYTGSEPLQPQGRYWFHLDPQSGRAAAWSFTPTQIGDQTPAVFLWNDWQRVESVQLPVKFTQEGGGRVIEIENLYAPGSVEHPLFEQP